MANYNVEEQETVIVYDSVSKQFDIYTSVPKHIKQLKTVDIATILQDETDEQGVTIAYRIRVEKLPPSYTFNR